MKSNAPSSKWLRMAALYKRFALDYPAADFGDDAATAMYLHESTGAPLPDARTNGFALGKKWLDVTVAAWKEDIPQGGLLVSELQADGYPDWFLERVGVLEMKPTDKACAWWRAGSHDSHLEQLNSGVLLDTSGHFGLHQA